MILEVNTIEQEYYLKIGTLAKIKLESHPNKILQIRLRTFFRNFYFYPLIPKVREKKADPIRKNKKRKRGKMKIRTVLKLIRSFKVKELKVVIDTGDCIANSKWYPLFYFMNEYAGQWAINYEGKNSLQLRLVNRPVYVIKSFIN
jgi:hypothetical protein